MRDNAPHVFDTLKPLTIPTHARIPLTLPALEFFHRHPTPRALGTLGALVALGAR